MGKWMGLLLAALLLAGCAAADGGISGLPVPLLDNVSAGMQVKSIKNKEIVEVLESHLPYLDEAMVGEREFQVLYISDGEVVTNLILLITVPPEEEPEIRQDFFSNYGEPLNQVEQGTDFVASWFFDEEGNELDGKEGLAYQVVYMTEASEESAGDIDVRIDFDYLLWFLTDDEELESAAETEAETEEEETEQA